MTIGTEKDPHSMDAHRNPGIQGIVILPQILDGLLNSDDQGNVIPGLAEAMPERPDPLTYIFHLRQRVKFHDGTEFDARDVKFSFDRLLNRDISYHWKTYEAIIKRVEILDPYKVKITLTGPQAAFLDMMAKFTETRIIPRGSGTNIVRPIGTGPFKFKEWIKDDRLILIKNEHYGETGLPYLNQIIYKPFPEPATRVINLKTGAVDLVHDLPIRDAVELKKLPGLKILGRSGGQVEQLGFNTAKPPFNNKKVRQAIAYGIDRKEVTESVFIGFSEVSQDLFPSWFWAHNPNIKAYPYHPEKAKALLKEAGYSPEKPFSFRILCTNEPIFTDQAVIIQAQLAKIGVKVDILPVEKSFYVDSASGRKGRDYEASLEDMSDDTTDLQWVYRFFSGKSFFNWTAYNSQRYSQKGAQNPEVERLLDEVIKISDRTQARRIYDDVQRMILDDMPMLYLSFYQNVIGLRDYVKNHKVLTRNTIPLKEVWVEK